MNDVATLTMLALLNENLAVPFVVINQASMLSPKNGLNRFKLLCSQSHVFESENHKGENIRIIICSECQFNSQGCVVFWTITISETQGFVVNKMTSCMSMILNEILNSISQKQSIISLERRNNVVCNSRIKLKSIALLHC